jgi:NAD(P)-dependent dehydrogenase (short-subunit alcohol dehydrogenase family)
MAFDVKSGRFTLTFSMALFWWRRDGKKPENTKAIADRLRECGIKVHQVCPAWIQCDMRPRAIQEALGGGSADTSSVASFWTPEARKACPEWAADELAVAVTN